MAITLVRMDANNCASTILFEQFRKPSFIRRRHAGSLANVFPPPELAAVTAKVFRDVAAVLKAVHDVFEIGGVAQTERMPGLVQAGEIDDGFPEQALPVVGTNIDISADGFAIEPVARRNPVNADLRARRFGSFFESQFSIGCRLPRLERPPGELGVALAASGLRPCACVNPIMQSGGMKRSANQDSENQPGRAQDTSISQRLAFIRVLRCPQSSTTPIPIPTRAPRPPAKSKAPSSTIRPA